MLKKTLVTEKGEVSVQQVHNSFILEGSCDQIIALCQQLGTCSISWPSDLRQLGEIKRQASLDKPTVSLEETNINGRLQLNLTDEQFILRLRDQCGVKAESPSQSSDLTTIKKRLQARYEQNSQIKRLFYPNAPLALKDCYLQLALLQDEKHLEEKPPTGTEKSPERDYVLREYERLQASGQKLEVAQILDKCPAKMPRRIYVEGAAGAGKSTLCWYIADQWAMGQAPWSSYEWVFLIRLRELAQGQYMSTSGLNFIQLIADKCLQTGTDSELLEPEKEALLATLKQAPQRVLLLLDGLDEMNAEQQGQATWEKLVHSHYDLLVTARPGVSHSVKEALGTTLSLGVLGFSDEQVATYVKHFFTEKTPELSSNNVAPCLAFLQGNPNIWSLSHTPIQLELICSIWGKDLQALQPVTLTGLYELMLDKILAREFHKQQPQVPVGQLIGLEQEERYQSALPYLERLAFLGMQAKQIVLSAPLMHQAHAKTIQKNLKEKNRLWQLLEATGLVKRHNEGAQAEFAHLTFQEYFAARYVARSIMACWDQPAGTALPEGLDSQALQNLIAATKFDSFYTVTWSFVAGLLARAYPNPSQPLALQRLVDSFLAFPRSELDLAELSLLLRCLEEAPQIVISQHPQLMANLQRWAEFYVACDYDLNNTLLAKLWQTLRACPSLVGQLVQAKPALLSFLSEQLQHKDWQPRDRAIDTFGSWGRLLPAVAEVLLPLLGHAKDAVREVAAQAVGAIGAQASAELQAGLAALLTDKKAWVREAAARAVRAIGPKASIELQRGLAALLSDEDKDVRSATAYAVGAIGPKASIELQRGLAALLADKDKDVRRAAAWAVGKLGAKASIELQRGLVTLLADKDNYVCSAAAEAVGKLGAKASIELQRGLVILLAYKENYVRSAAANAVRTIGAQVRPELQGGLVPLLSDEDNYVRGAAVRAVGAIGAQASIELQQGLAALLSDKDEWVRNAAARAVGAIGAQASIELQQGLALLLTDKDEWVRSAAAYAVEKLGAKASIELQQGLAALLADKEAEVRMAAALAVGAIGAQASPELQAGLGALLADEDRDVSRAAAYAVGAIGVQASPELQSALIILSTHPEKAVRREAMGLLAKLPQTFEYFCRQLLAERFPVSLCISSSNNLPPQHTAPRLAKPVSTQPLQPQPTSLRKPEVSNFADNPSLCHEGQTLGGSSSVKPALATLSAAPPAPLLPLPSQTPSVRFLPQYASFAAKNSPPAPEGVSLNLVQAGVFRVTIHYSGLGLSLEQAKLLQPNLTGAQGLGSFDYIEGSVQRKRDCITQLDFDDELAAQGLVQTIQQAVAQLRQEQRSASLPCTSLGGN